MAVVEMGFGENFTQDMKLDEKYLNVGFDLKSVNELAERLDLTDVLILRKFYFNKRDSTSSTVPYCFPLLYKEMKEVHKMKIGIEALRKRLKVLLDIGLLVKVERSNPSSYLPVEEKTMFVKAVIIKFGLINGFTNFV